VGSQGAGNTPEREPRSRHSPSQRPTGGVLSCDRSPRRRCSGRCRYRPHYRDATRPPNGDDYLGPSELYQLVRFVIESEVSRRLLRDHLGLDRSRREAADEPVDGPDRAPGSRDRTDDVSGDGRSGMPAANGAASEGKPDEPDAGADSDYCGNFQHEGTKEPGSALTDRFSRHLAVKTHNRQYETSAVSRRNVLAGFGGFLVGAGVVATVTGAGPVGATSDGGTDGRVGSSEFDGSVAVPGVSVEGVVDPAVLVDSHATFLGTVRIRSPSSD